MDENTRFLLQRMDDLEARLVSKIDDLQGFKNKILGVAIVVSGFVAAAVEALLR